MPNDCCQPFETKSANQSPVRVLGVGSPHGDDQLGWMVVDHLRRDHIAGVEAVPLHSPFQLLDHLDNCRFLILVDGCQMGDRAGTIHHLVWPDFRSLQGSPSTHGLDIGLALGLAEQLGQLPEQIHFLGMEIADCQPGRLPGPIIQEGILFLVQKVRQEIQRIMAHLDRPALP